VPAAGLTSRREVFTRRTLPIEASSLTEPRQISLFRITSEWTTTQFVDSSVAFPAHFSLRTNTMQEGKRFGANTPQEKVRLAMPGSQSVRPKAARKSEQRRTASFTRCRPHRKSIHPMGAPALLLTPTHRLDEFPAGYSLAVCSPAWPASASPTGGDFEGKGFCRTINSQQTVNSALTTCLTAGAHPRGRVGSLAARTSFFRSEC
jgi:hypothetical protein